MISFVIKHYMMVCSYSLYCFSVRFTRWNSFHRRNNHLTSRTGGFKPPSEKNKRLSDAPIRVWTPLSSELVRVSGEGLGVR